MKSAKILTVILCLALLTGAVSAAECGPYSDQDVAGKPLDELMAQFMEENGLDETNYSVFYRNTVTQEEYRFNERWFAYGASTYKLPLNLYFYELENAGKIDPDMVMTQGGARLPYVHEESIINSNNELTFSMISYLGGFEGYKRAMLKFFSMPEEQIDPSYFYDHIYCTEMMMDVLQYLYDRQDQFPELMGYLKQASCHISSVSGEIAVSIQRKGRSKLQMTVTVPQGTEAEIVFPSGKTKTLPAGTHDIQG